MIFPTCLRSNEIRKWGSATLRQRGLERVPEHPLDALQALVAMDSAVWAAR